MQSQDPRKNKRKRFGDKAEGGDEGNDDKNIFENKKDKNKNNKNKKSNNQRR